MDPEKLTAAEEAAEKQRKEGLAAEIKRKDDVELNLFAQQIGVDATKYPKREDLEAAIELKAEQDAAAGRKAIRDADQQQADSVAGEEDKRSMHARAVRALDAEFCRQVPQEAFSGSFDPGEEHPRFGGEYNVPDGKYRRTGSEWVFEFKKKRLVGAVRANEANSYGGKNVKHVD
ncbi:hypothetical protein [Bradyrhizobium sp.]|uniref:hypothetical protein n=1 Tax=Bradyrhizobium sp. TaxID=376 RepID=UPI0039E3C393